MLRDRHHRGRSARDNQSILRCGVRAIELGAPLDRLFAVHFARSEALFFLGRKRSQRRALESALTFASTAAERAAARAELGWCLANARESERALALLEVAVEEAQASGDVDVRVRALGRQVVALIYAGHLDRAEAALRVAEGITSASLGSRSLLAGWRGQFASAKGDPGARSVAFLEAAARYENVGDVRRAAGARTNLADACDRVGAYSEAEDSLRTALVDCRRVGHRLMEGYALLNLGYACMMQKKIMQASAALDDCATIARETTDTRLNCGAASIVARTAQWVARSPPPSLSRKSLAKRERRTSPASRSQPCGWRLAPCWPEATSPARSNSRIARSAGGTRSAGSKKMTQRSS